MFYYRERDRGDSASMLRFDIPRKDRTFKVNKYFIIEKEIKVSTRQDSSLIFP